MYFLHVQNSDDNDFELCYLLTKSTVTIGRKLSDIKIDLSKISRGLFYHYHFILFK
jgi:hypothetical protein